MSTESTTYGRNCRLLFTLLERLGEEPYTQKEFAEELGVVPWSVSQWFIGERLPRRSTREVIVTKFRDKMNIPDSHLNDEIMLNRNLADEMMSAWIERIAINDLLENANRVQGMLSPNDNTNVWSLLKSLVGGEGIPASRPDKDQLSD